MYIITMKNENRTTLPCYFQGLWRDIVHPCLQYDYSQDVSSEFSKEIEDYRDDMNIE